MRKLVSLFLGALLVFPAFCMAKEETDSFQCAGGIVAPGDSKREVVRKCGKPTRKSIVYKGTILYKRTRSLEKWTYDLGPDNFVYLLTFEGDKVVHIYNLEYYGK